MLSNRIINYFKNPPEVVKWILSFLLVDFSLGIVIGMALLAAYCTVGFIIIIGILISVWFAAQVYDMIWN